MLTGYEVEITGEVKGGVKSEVLSVSDNRLSVKSIKNEDLINGKEYTVRVQSVNGAWRSGYSTAVKVTPEASKRPDPPEGITVKGSYRSLDVSWKKMKDTDTYSLFYGNTMMPTVNTPESTTLKNTSQMIQNPKG